VYNCLQQPFLNGACNITASGYLIMESKLMASKLAWKNPGYNNYFHTVENDKQYLIR
jgi:hypothetical protein